jgi:micrococcal nuclease
MMKNKELKIVLIFLIVLLFVLNYKVIDDFLVDYLNNRESVVINSVIDGDTVKVNGSSIRLLGINAPESHEKYYEEAKEFLELEVLNKTVYLEYGKERYDKYHRVLAYIFIENININKKIVEKGFANYYFPSGRDKYYPEFKQAWETCLDSNLNLCEKSLKCKDCIDIKENSIINTCNEPCNINNWSIKAEGRDVFFFNNIVLNKGMIAEFNLSVNKQDSLFLRDDNFNLVLWKSYPA